jgi:hypothetical protein
LLFQHCLLASVPKLISGKINNRGDRRPTMIVSAAAPTYCRVIRRRLSPPNS